MDRFGISSAMLTPFAADGRLDETLFARHANAMLAAGLDSVTLYGTTGEGASIGQAERARGVASLLGAGIPAERILICLCASALEDALAEVTAHIRTGITSFLLVPPFYFKGCTDDGLFDWHAGLFTRADPRARFILYHIPQVTGVPLSVSLVARLATRFPDRVQAIKDSSGSWENAEALLSGKATRVLIGDERLLHRAAALGGSGAITGMANLHPERMLRLFETAAEDPDLSEEVTRIVSLPVVPALKAVLAARTGESGWSHLRPPLAALDEKDRAALLAAHQAAE